VCVAGAGEGVSLPSVSKIFGLSEGMHLISQTLKKHRTSLSRQI
jgi:hypothetical protein